MALSLRFSAPLFVTILTLLQGPPPEVWGRSVREHISLSISGGTFVGVDKLSDEDVRILIQHGGDTPVGQHNLLQAAVRLPRVADPGTDLLITFSSSHGMVAERFRIERYGEMGSLAEQRGTLKGEGVAVVKVLQAVVSLWHRYVTLHRSWELPFKTKVATSGAHAGIQTKCTDQNGHFDYLCALKEVLGHRSIGDTHPPDQAIALRNQALALIVAYRDYTRLAHSYGDGHASAGSFDRRGGEGAWLSFTSLDSSSLKELARMAGGGATADEESAIPDTTLERIFDSAYDDEWNTDAIYPALNGLMYRYG